MDWVADNHIQPAVANLSLGGGASSTVDAAVQRMVDAGVTVAVAAGNSNTDACTTSPARAASAITVGSTTSTDARSYFSNFGSCVDIFAPGSIIKSAWHTSNTAVATLDGTSMASPHVAGAAALILGQSPSLTPSQVTSQLVNAATTGVVGSAGTGSPNRLLYSENGPAQPQALAITTSSLPTATVNTVYSATLQAIGGTSPYTWSTTGLPNGLSLATDGKITGTPTATGSYTLVVTATDAVSASVTSNVSLTVAPAKVFPGAFGKTSPLSGATGISRSSARLTWSTSANATSYRVCLSTSSSCNTWYNLSNVTSATFSGLRGRTTYYWRVEARTSDGTILADSGTTWRFTTAR
jgi:subtilisin family serine protease